MVRPAMANKAGWEFIADNSGEFLIVVAIHALNYTAAIYIIYILLPNDYKSFRIAVLTVNAGCICFVPVPLRAASRLVKSKNLFRMPTATPLSSKTRLTSPEMAVAYKFQQVTPYQILVAVEKICNGLAFWPDIYYNSFYSRRGCP